MIARILLVLVIIVFLFPAYFMVIGSLQDIHGIFIMPPRMLPLQPTLSNYRWLAMLPILRWGANTLFVVGIGVTLTILVSVSAGYVFAFYTFPLKNILWVMLMAGIMVPYMSLIVPLFVVVKKLGLAGTIWSVIIPRCYLGYLVYLSRSFFETVPMSVLESARIDGAGDMRTLVQIVMPISRPIITAVGLFALFMYQGDYLWQTLQLRRNDLQTMLVGLMRSVMTTGGDTDMQLNPVGQSFAVATFLFIPIFIVFMFANRYFTSALGGAVKE